MPRLSDSIIHEFGISKELYKKNYGTQRVSEKANHEAYDKIVKAIEEKGDWCKMSTVTALKYYGLTQTEVRTFCYHLQEYPNIIARVNPKYNGLSRQERRTVPLEYMYVPAEEKKGLGFRAYGYKNIFGDSLRRFEECFADMPDIHINALLSMADCLIRRGADEGWVRIEIMVTARDAGISIEEAVGLLRHMSKKKIFSIASVREEGLIHEMRPACRFAVSDAMYEEYEKEVAGGDIKISDLNWKEKLTTRKSTNVSIRPFELFDLDETENETSAEQELYSKLDELMKAYRFRVETELGKKYEKQIKELRELKNELEKRCDEQTSKVSDLNTKFVNAAAEATNCQTQLTAAEAELKRVKYINEKNIKFKEKLVDHLNEQLQILSSEMMELSIRMTSANPYQIRDKAFIASIRKESMNIVNNVSQEIQNFRIEGVPNELVTNKEKKGLTHATS